MNFSVFREALEMAERGELSRVEKDLLVVFSYFLADNEAHVCWPFRNRIAKMAGVSTKAITDAGKSLERKSLLKIEHPPRFSRLPNRYHLQLATRLDCLFCRSEPTSLVEGSDRRSNGRSD